MLATEKGLLSSRSTHALFNDVWLAGVKGSSNM